jgi:hypothetical protein
MSLYDDRATNLLDYIDSDLKLTNELLEQLLTEIKALRQSPPFVPGILSIEATRIPSDAFLAISVHPDMLDVDMVRLRAELRAHLGDRKIMVYRAGDEKLGVIAFEEAAE